MNETKSSEPVFHPGASFKAIDLKHRRSMEDLRCSVEWCTGHTTNEADSWDDLMHRGPAVNLLPTGSRMNADRIKADLIPLLGRDGIAYNVYFTVEGELSSEQALSFADRLRNAADLLERAVRRHPELVKAGQIGVDR